MQNRQVAQKLIDDGSFIIPLFPNAKKNEPGKTNPSQETKDARVEENNTASNSENGSS